MPIGDTGGWSVGYTCDIIVTLELNTLPARSDGGMQTWLINFQETMPNLEALLFSHLWLLAKIFNRNGLSSET